MICRVLIKNILFIATVGLVYTPIALSDQLNINLNEGLEISFEELSPAFAALEDDFWLDEVDDSAEHETSLPIQRNLLDTESEINLDKLSPDKAFKNLKIEGDDLGLIHDNKTSKLSWTEIIEDKSQKPKATVATVNESKTTLEKSEYSTAPVEQVVKQINEEQFLKQSQLEKKNKKIKNIKVAGNIELAEGLAYIYGETNLFVGWSDGESDKVGDVWIDKAEYRIVIPELKGEIIAQITNKKGEVIGEATYDLSEISNSNYADREQYAIDLTLEPVSEDFEVELESVYSFDEFKFPVEGASVTLSFGDQVEYSDKAGKVKFPEVRRNSQALLQAEKAGYIKTIVAIDGEADRAKVTMFPQQYFNAMAKTIGLDSKKMLKLGTVWGQVVSNGRPVAGAKIKTEQGQPIYFHNYVANTSSTATGQDGAFVIPMLGEGLNFVSIDFNGKKYQAKPVPVVLEGISIVTFDINEKSVVRKVVTAFDGKAISNDVDAQIFGKDITYSINNSEINLTSSRGISPTLVELIKDNKIKYNTFTSLKNKYDEIPIPEDSHLDQIIKGNDATPIVFAYLEFEGVENVLVNQSEENINVIYFDKYGSITQNKSLAKAFILYGLDEGLHFLTINYSKDIRREALVLTDKATVSLVH